MLDCLYCVTHAVCSPMISLYLDPGIWILPVSCSPIRCLIELRFGDGEGEWCIWSGWLFDTSIWQWSEIVAIFAYHNNYYILYTMKLRHKKIRWSGIDIYTSGPIYWSIREICTPSCFRICCSLNTLIIVNFS